MKRENFRGLFPSTIGRQEEKGMDRIKINRKLRFLALSVLTGMFVLGLAGDSFAQGRYSDRYSRMDVDRIIRNMEQNSDEFRTDFRREMNNSNLNSSTRNRFNGYVATMENSVDDLRRHFDRNDSWWESRSRVQSVVNSSQNVNTMMRTLPFRRSLERQWNQLRNQINRVADTYDLPGLDGGGWRGGPWNPGNPGYPGGGGGVTPPSWAQGTFYGVAPNGSRIVLTIDRNGNITALIDGSRNYGAYLRNNYLRMNEAVARVTRQGNGIVTTRNDTGERIVYSRNQWDGGYNPGYPGYPGNEERVSPPSWARGTFYGTAPDGTRITLTIRNNGEVIANIGGSMSYGSYLRNDYIRMNEATARVTRSGNGFRMTRTDNGEVIYYRR